MNTDMRRTTGLTRSTTALGAAVLVLGSLALGACSKTDATGTAASTIGAAVEPGAAPGRQAAADSDTVDLVSATLESPATTDGARVRETEKVCAPGSSAPSMPAG